MHSCWQISGNHQRYVLEDWKDSLWGIGKYSRNLNKVLPALVTPDADVILSSKSIIVLNRSGLGLKNADRPTTVYMIFWHYAASVWPSVREISRHFWRPVRPCWWLWTACCLWDSNRHSTWPQAGFAATFYLTTSVIRVVLNMIHILAQTVIAALRDLGVFVFRNRAASHRAMEPQPPSRQSTKPYRHGTCQFTSTTDTEMGSCLKGHN